VLDRLEKGIAGYERIARHAVSAEAALVITAQGLEGDQIDESKASDTTPDEAEGSETAHAKARSDD
jgi:hypothetical protein